MDVAGRCGFPTDRLTIEVSETAELPEGAHAPDQLPLFRSRGVHVALDDFGAGYSGLQMLYRAESDVIKIDRFFISDVDKDSTKRIFVTNLVNMAHAMGLHVVGEGVETPQEYYACRDMGCDSIQGYLVARPEPDHARLMRQYPIIEELVALDRRRTRTAGSLLKERIDRIEPIVQGTPILEVLRRFRLERETSFIPVVNGFHEPLGILREHDLKEYVYSPYGISLLMNDNYAQEPYSYVRRVPVAPAQSTIDRILELAAIETTAEAIIITENGGYLGCLNSKTLIQILHERELGFARDQNPLTRLPGNTLIEERMALILRPNRNWTILAYVDFDNFKPFNDTYGFRVGDRVIQLFSNLLHSTGIARRDFAGHVGGDDFVLVMARDEHPLEDALGEIERLLRRFAGDVRSFYDSRDQEAGGIVAADRSGIIRHFPLLTAAAAVAIVPPHTEAIAPTWFSRHLSRLKKQAKHSPGRATIATFIPPSAAGAGCRG
jgi:diguanylate cyclase (GGDEF)-like protein